MGALAVVGVIIALQATVRFVLAVIVVIVGILLVTVLVVVEVVLIQNELNCRLWSKLKFNQSSQLNNQLITQLISNCLHVIIKVLVMRVVFLMNIGSLLYRQYIWCC